MTPPERILVYQMIIPIRWGDMDAMGHINNTLYFRYFETARIDWMHSLGLQPDPQGEGTVLINAALTFIKQISYPGDVIVRHYVGAIGRSSFETYCTMSRSDDPDTIYCEGSAKMVWVDLPKGKSAPLPDSARAKITRPWKA